MNMSIKIDTEKMTCGKVARLARSLAAVILIACLICAFPISYSHAAGSGMVTLTVSQTVVSSGGAAIGSGNFTYMLYPTSASSPMPSGSAASGYTFTVTGSSAASIGPITYAKGGKYSYTLENITAEAQREGYIVDDQRYTVEVYVRNTMSTAVVAYREDGNKVPDMTYGHSLKKVAPVDDAPPGGGDPPGGGEVPSSGTETKTGDKKTSKPASDKDKPKTSVVSRNIASGNLGAEIMTTNGTQSEVTVTDGTSGDGTGGAAGTPGSSGSTIISDKVPMSSPGDDYAHSLLSLIMTITAFAISVISVIWGLLRRERGRYSGLAEESGDHAMHEKIRRRKVTLRILSVFSGILTVAVWLILEGFDPRMVFINRYTPYVATAFILHILCLIAYYASGKVRIETEDEME
jgi:hypothetical protein